MRGNSLHWIRGILLLLMTGYHGALFAQGEIAISDFTEELLSQDETAAIPTPQLEQCTHYRHHPLNLNNATREQLAESGFFNSFQIEVLVAYREKFGALFSIYELSGLSGFRKAEVLKLAPYLTVGPGSPPPASDPGNLMALFTFGYTFPTANGFNNADSMKEVAAYSGTALKTGFRLRTVISSSFSAGLGYEKDPGETFLRKGIPEFLSGFLMYRGTRQLQKLVIGNFRVQHGLGLVNGSLFISTVESYLSPSPSVSRIIPYAGLGESNFERGAAGQLKIGKMGLMIWVSHRPMDLTLQHRKEISAHTDWERNERESGLHRTTTELAGRSLAYRVHQGLEASYRYHHLTLGAMCGWRINGLTIMGRDSLQLEGKPFRTMISSFHGAWYGKRIGLSWELAVTGRGESAFLAAFHYRLNDFMQGMLLVHRYGPNYVGMYPATYAAGSQFSNDRGVAIGWRLEAGKYFVATLKYELFRHQAPRYLAKVPSGSYRAVCTFTNAGINDLQWKFRIYHKGWQTNLDNEGSGIDPLAGREIIRSEIQFVYIPGTNLSRKEDTPRYKEKIPALRGSLQAYRTNFQWQSRLILSWPQESPVHCPDYAVVQRISLAVSARFRGVLQVAGFHVTSWENRIYIYEPGLLYSFNFPVCYGTGEKITGILSARVWNKVTFSWRLAATLYHDRYSTGTGLNSREGNKQWEAGFQIRLNF